ncbi:MAG: hypothetical protein B7Z08_11730 [Sphingomonadales bacterium 32-68-7]|nr:MAG: hypothetical protein B7Z33_05710 [Sphingomonadales bacterium 12-68-11]OYX07788.1 MAG: hypothetical protein B7Z08_11730 [Sphingomonadales bacterium 32-68-7]
MKKLAVLAAAAALAMPAAASAQVVITAGSAPAVSALNDFKTQLAGLGLTQMSTNATLDLDAGNWAITYYLLGSESGFNDTFTAPDVNFTETTGYSPWGESFIGVSSLVGWAGGSLGPILNFSSVGGAPASLGNTGFGVFLSAAQAGSETTNSTFYFGYDDQITNPDDDNHDDLIIKAVVSPIPEPSTWGLMILGFGALGMAMRGSRRRETSIGKINFA